MTYTIAQYQLVLNSQEELIISSSLYDYKENLVSEIKKFPTLPEKERSVEYLTACIDDVNHIDRLMEKINSTDEKSTQELSRYEFIIIKESLKDSIEAKPVYQNPKAQAVLKQLYDVALRVVEMTAPKFANVVNGKDGTKRTIPFMNSDSPTNPRDHEEKWPKDDEVKRIIERFLLNATDGVGFKQNVVNAENDTKHTNPFKSSDSPTNPSDHEKNWWEDEEFKTILQRHLLNRTYGVGFKH